jgi:hypothetical protein
VAPFFPLSQIKVHFLETTLFQHPYYQRLGKRMGGSIPVRDTGVKHSGWSTELLPFATEEDEIWFKFGGYNRAFWQSRRSLR